MIRLNGTFLRVVGGASLETAPPPFLDAFFRACLRPRAASSDGSSTVSKKVQVCVANLRIRCPSSTVDVSSQFNVQSGLNLLPKTRAGSSFLRDPLAVVVLRSNLRNLLLPYETPWTGVCSKIPNRCQKNPGKELSNRWWSTR